MIELPTGRIEDTMSLKKIGQLYLASASLDNPKKRLIDDRWYFRFMDRIYIPCQTNELNTAQISQLNRLRETIIRDPEQYYYNDLVKSIIENISKFLPARYAIELGPGKFPLNLHANRIDRIEVDEEAIKHLRSMNINIQNECCFQIRHEIDFVAASFVFHFSVREKLISEIASSLSDNGVIVFNVPTKKASIRTNAISVMSGAGLYSKVLDIGDHFDKNDVLVISGKKSAVDAMHKIYDFASVLVERKTACQPH